MIAKQTLDSPPPTCTDDGRASLVGRVLKDHDRWSLMAPADSAQSMPSTSDAAALRIPTLDQGASPAGLLTYSAGRPLGTIGGDQGPGEVQVRAVRPTRKR